MSVILEDKTDTKIKLQPPLKYNIWALDNDATAFDEVVAILVRSTGVSPSVAAELTRKVDTEGKAKVNPRPLPRGLADAQLNKINNVKRALAKAIPFREKPIMMLKFIVKAD